MRHKKHQKRRAWVSPGGWNDWGKLTGPEGGHEECFQEWHAACQAGSPGRRKENEDLVSSKSSQRQEVVLVSQKGCRVMWFPRVFSRFARVMSRSEVSCTSCVLGRFGNGLTIWEEIPSVNVCIWEWDGVVLLLLPHSSCSSFRAVETLHWEYEGTYEAGAVFVPTSIFLWWPVDSRLRDETWPFLPQNKTKQKLNGERSHGHYQHKHGVLCMCFCFSQFHFCGYASKKGRDCRCQLVWQSSLRTWLLFLLAMDLSY